MRTGPGRQPPEIVTEMASQWLPHILFLFFLDFVKSHSKPELFFITVSPKSGSREVVYLMGKKNIGQSSRTLHSPSPETCHDHVMRKISIVKGNCFIKLVILHVLVVRKECFISSNTR